MDSARSGSRRAATAAALVRQGQWRELLRAAVPSALLYVNDFHFVCLQEVRAPARRLEGFFVRLAGAADLPAMQAIHPRGIDYPAKLERGDLCLLAVAGQRPAAMAWFDLLPRHRSPHHGFVFPVGPDGCWSYWVEVHPDFRLRGALVRLWQDGLALLQARGLRRVYSAIEESNRASLTSHGRLGFDPVCRYRVIRALGISRYRVRSPGGATRRGWGTWDGSYPG